MRSRSGNILFNQYDHQLLQSVSTRRESQEHIQPISMTDIKLSIQQNDPPIDRSEISQNTTQIEYTQINSPLRLELKKEDDSFGMISNNSPSSHRVSKGQNQRPEYSFEINAQMSQIGDQQLQGSQKTQQRAIAQSIKIQDKSIENTTSKLELEFLQFNESTFLKKRIRPSLQVLKNLADSKISLNKCTSNDKTGIMSQKSRPPTTQLFKRQSLQQEIEEPTLLDLKNSVRNQVIKMLYRLLEATFNRRFQSLTLQHLLLIKDRSSHFIKESKNNPPKIFNCLSLLECKVLNSMVQLKYILKRLIFKIPIIQPTHQFNIILNIIQMISLMSLYFLYSFTIFFFFKGNSITKMAEISSIIISFADISTKFFVGIYNKGEIVLDRQFIFKNYIKSTFFVDSLSLLSVIGSVVKLSNNYWITSIVQSIFFVRVFSTQEVIRRIDHLIHMVGKANDIYSLFKLVIKLVILCHVISTCFYIVAVIQQTSFSAQNTWLDTLMLNSTPWYEIYVFAFFYSFNTIMLSSTYNLNSVESLFTIIVMCSTIGDILESENKKKREFKFDLEAINEYMRKKNLKKEIQSKVYNFLEYLYEEKGDIKNNKEAISVLKRLPVNLREDIQQDINQKVVESFSSICKTFSEKIKKKTVQIIEEECFLPNEIIFKQGSFNNQALYLVKKGQVILEKVQQNGETVAFSVQEKEGIFGEKNFFSGMAFDYQARSGDFTTVYKIPRKEFVDILRSSNDDFEQFCVTRDSILLQNNSPFLKVNCKICQSKYHTENNCDKVHFSPNSSLIIKKFLYNLPAERQISKRKSKLRMNATHFVNVMRDVCDRITSNPDFIPILEVIELDNTPQQNLSESFITDDGSNPNLEDEQDEEDQDKEDEDQSNQKDKIHPHNRANQTQNRIIEEVEEMEHSTVFNQEINDIQLEKNQINDGFSLSHLPNVTPNSPKLSYQNLSNQQFIHTPNYGSAFQGVKQGILMSKSNTNIHTNGSSLSNSSIPNILSSMIKISLSKNIFQQTDEIFKSSTLNSQKTNHSCQKNQFKLEAEPFIEQKSNFSKRKQRKQKCILFSKNPTKQLSKHFTGQMTNQSVGTKSKRLDNEGDVQQLAIYQQLTKMNTFLERQISQIEPTQSLKVHSNHQENKIPDVKLDQNNNPQQLNDMQQHLLLFDQIKQNLLDLQKQTPINNIIFSNDFDKMKKYRIYFPLGNYSYIIMNLNKNKKILIRSVKRNLNFSKIFTTTTRKTSQEQQKQQ